MRTNVILSLAAGGALALTMAGCGAKAASRVKGGEIQQTIDTTNADNDRYIEFDGIGAADNTLTNESQKKSLSEAAGRKIAEEKLLAYLKGQQIDANTTVDMAMIKNQTIQGIVSNTLRGVMIVKREWTSDDGCVVTVRLDKKKFMDQVKGAYSTK